MKVMRCKGKVALKGDDVNEGIMQGVEDVFEVKPMRPWTGPRDQGYEHVFLFVGKNLDEAKIRAALLE